MEARQASEIFILAVRKHLLDDTLEKCHPENVDRGLSCGDGIVWPAAQSTDSHQRDPYTKGLYLSYDIQFDHVGMVVNAFLRAVDFRYMGIPSSSVSTRRACLNIGEAVTLCPLAVQATFVRWYGLQSPDQASKKQAEREQVNIGVLATDFATQLAESCKGENGQVEGAVWALCKIGEQDIVWPSNYCLISSIREDQTTKYTSSEKGCLPTRRYPHASPSSLNLMSRRQRMEQLAERTSNYIELQSRERERERKEKLDRTQHTPAHPTAASTPATVSTPTPSAGLVASPAFGSMTSPAGLQPINSPMQRHMSSGTSPATLEDTASTHSTTKPTIPQIAASQRKTPGSHCRDLALGVPTLASLEAMLPAAAPLSPPMQAASTGHSASGMELDVSNSKDQHLYPTPQSTSIEQVSTSMENPSTSDSTSSGVPNLNAVTSASKLGTNDDDFDDFFWNSYPSGDMSFGSGGGGNELNSFLDNNLDMFDSGITEDDFSFFDTPSLPVSVSLQPHGVPAPRLVEDPLQFITSLNTVNHFGHLMPSGDSPVAFASHPIRSPDHDPSATSALSSTLTPTNLFSSESLLVGAPASLEPPRHFAGVETIGQGRMSPSVAASEVPLYTPTTVEPFNSIVEIHQSMECKYTVDLQLSNGALLTSHCPKYPLQVSAYTPLPFGLHHIDSDERFFAKTGKFCTFLQPRHEEEAEDLIQMHRKAKAQALRARADLKKGRDTSQSKQLGRNWTPQKELAELTFEDSSSASDSSSEVESIGWNSLYEASPYPPSTPLIAGSVVGPALLGIRSLLLEVPPVPEKRVLDERPSEKVKLSKGEREALATVFAQQYLENVDLRDRILETTPHFSLAPSMSPPLPLSFQPSTKLTKTQETFISVFCHSAIMQMSTSALRFWTKIGLQPSSGPKDVRAFILAASSLVHESLGKAVEPWLEKLAFNYQVIRIHIGLIFWLKQDMFFRIADSAI